MARTATDLKVLFEVMQGPDDGDPSAAPVPVHWPERDDFEAAAHRLFRRRWPHARDRRNSGGRTERRPTPCRGQGFRSSPSVRKDSRPLVNCGGRLFGVAGGMLLGPMMKGHEAEISPLLKEFSSGVAAEPAHSGESLARYLGATRPGTREDTGADAQLSGSGFVPAAAIPAFRHGERSWLVEGKNGPVS